MGDRRWGTEGRGGAGSAGVSPASPHPPSPISHPLLIVNADDFGISEGVNRGIAEAFERGILTSTTLMSNMPAFEDAVRITREHNGLGVGVHLNLTSGAPVLPSGRISGLVGTKGQFLPLGPVLRKLTLGRLDLSEAEAELGAQIEKALEAGIVVTHLDSHHHVHMHPFFHRLVLRLARRYGIGAVRSTSEMGPGGIARRAGMLLQENGRDRFLKTVVLSLFGMLLRSRARLGGVAVPDHFRGLVLDTAFTTEMLLPVLDRLSPGATELMCHPGYVDEGLRRATSYSAGRDSELAALLDPRTRAVLDNRRVQLGSFAGLTGVQERVEEDGKS